MEPIIGEIKLFSGNYAPMGFLLCNGQAVSVQRYPVLFSLIGYEYGGSGSVFNLPTIPSLPVAGGPALNYIIGVTGDYPRRP